MTENNRKTFPSQYTIATLMTLSIVMIAVLTYFQILRYSFTAADTLSLIDTSRIQSLKDLISVFTHPLMVGTEFEGHTLYYRPIVSLSYGLDYYIWGLNPFGYHLTNLILHVTVSALVFITTFYLTGGRKAISWLSAVIFTTHPILVECVPAIARRHDILAALFQLLSLTFFLNYMSNPKRKRTWSLLLSILVYVIALGSKEISILLPFVVCGYLFVFHIVKYEHRSFRFATFQPLKICLPYFAMSVIYVVWRGYVVGGIGGVNQTGDFSYLNTFTSYFNALLYPVPFLGAGPGNLIWAAALIIIFILPMYLFISRNLTLINVRHSDVGRVVAFLLGWQLLPLGLLLATRTFSLWNMYVSVISFSAILSITLVESLRLAVQRLEVEQTATNSRWLPYAAGGTFIIVSGLVISLLSFSPITRTYGEWEDSGKISAMVLSKLSDAVKKLPDHTTIHIYDLPAGVSTYATIVPHVQSVRYLADYSIKSYLKMTNPDNQIEVVVENTIDLPTYPRDIDLITKMEPDNKVVITIKTIHGKVQ